MDVTFIALGVLGGLSRAVYGMFKSVGNRERIRKGYCIITLITGGVLGGLLGSFFDIDYHIAALGGYVGTDIIENLVKTAIPTSITLKK